jgi:hypothetical protein
LILLLFCCQLLRAQQIINGVVKDEQSLNPVPFATIGMTGKHFGTLTNEKGDFELSTPYFSDADTLKISAIGYETISLAKEEVRGIKNKILLLKPIAYELNEVKVKPLKVRTKILGTEDYSKKNCTAFMGENENWKGEQAAIKAGNKEGQTVYIEEFGFYIIKNDYPDSLKFRIMFYEVGAKGYPSKTFLKKPIVFKTNVKQGEVKVDLKDYSVSTTGDFFISLECLEAKMEAAKFCYAGSVGVPSFYKTTAYGRWGRVKGGGGDFNVKVSYVK